MKKLLLIFIFVLLAGTAYARVNGNYSNGIANDSHTRLLLHMDGTNNGTTFTDSSSSNHSIAKGGSPITSTTTKELGSASGNFNGTDAYLEMADSPDWTFGAGNWTIDFWAYKTTGGSSRVCGFWRNTTRNLLISMTSTASTIYAEIQESNGLLTCTWAGVFDYNAWTHVAVQRNGTAIELYVNGIKNATTFNISTYTMAHPSTYPFDIGCEYLTNGTPTTFFGGNIDELRISKGIARWLKNFTPPTRAN